MHDIGVRPNEYHDRMSCQTNVAPVPGITASTGAIAVLDPLLHAAILAYAVPLCFSISGPQSRFHRLQPKNLARLIVSSLQFMLMHNSSSLLFHPESLLSTGRKHTRLVVYFCLTNLVDCKSPEYLSPILAGHIYPRCMARHWAAHEMTNDRESGREKQT